MERNFTCIKCKSECRLVSVTFMDTSELPKVSITVRVAVCSSRSCLVSQGAKVTPYHSLSWPSNAS
jgi:hypothetical protein